jgi:hypothetical protein
MAVLDTNWRTLYRVAAGAALLVVATLPVAIVVYLLWPTPATVIDFFALLQANRLAGLVDLDLPLVLDQLLTIPIALALYVALRERNQSLMALATVGTIVGAVLIVVSHEATFSMAALSDQYAAATTDVERAVVLAAGQTLLAMFTGTAFSIGYVLAGLSGLVASWVMLGSRSFGRTTAYAGIALYALMVIPPTVGTVGLVMSFASLAPLAVWLVLIAWHFFELSRSSEQVKLPLSHEVGLGAAEASSP